MVDRPSDGEHLSDEPPVGALADYRLRAPEGFAERVVHRVRRAETTAYAAGFIVGALGVVTRALVEGFAVVLSDRKRRGDGSRSEP